MTAGRSILAAATLIALDPNEIDVSGRIGFYFPDKAEAFASLMTIDGQRDPIKVSRNPAGAALPWRLHVGLHRTMGARLAELPVYGLEVSGTPEELRELESSENLHRRNIEPIERAKFVFHTCEAARVRIARQHGNLKQQQLAVKARWARVKAGDDRAEQALGDEVGDTSDKLSLVYGWADAAAEALGFGKREIYRSLELYRLVIEPFPELAEPLAHHPIVGTNASQLREIAQVKAEAERRMVIEALLADPELSVPIAKARLELGVGATSEAQTAEQKIVSAVVGNLSRLSATVQKRHVDGIVRALKSDEVKRLLRDRLNEELGDAG